MKIIFSTAEIPALKEQFRKLVASGNTEVTVSQTFTMEFIEQVLNSKDDIPLVIDNPGALT